MSSGAEEGDTRGFQKLLRNLLDELRKLYMNGTVI